MPATEKFNELITLCEDLFVKQGVNGVTMEDIARRAGISKKTLYIYFRDKQAIVAKVIEGIINQLKFQLSYYESKAENPVHEIILLNGIIWQLAHFKSLLNPLSLRRYRSSANLFSNFKDHYLTGHLEKNLKQGVVAGYYRSEIDVQNTALIYVSWIIEGYYNRHLSLKGALEGNTIFTNGIVSDSARSLVSGYQTGSNGIGTDQNL